MITDDTRYVNFTIYSDAELSTELRKDFVLPGNPYSVKERGEACREFLKSLGVFFYRDEDNGRAVILDEDKIANESGFKAFRCRGILSRETMKIAEWDKPRTQTDKQELQKFADKHGDLNAWLEWNKEGVVVSCNDAEITFV